MATFNGMEPIAEESQNPKPLLPGKKPWNPGTWCNGLAIFFGFGAAGVLAGINWRRLGKPKWVWPSIILTIVGEVALVALLSVLKSTTGKEIGYLVNIGIGFGLSRLQRPAYDEWITNNGASEPKKPGFILPIGIGIGSIAAILAAAFGASTVQAAAVQRHLDAGTAYLSQGNYDQAIAEFNAMSSIDPTVPSSYIGRGLVYLYKNEYDQSLLNFNRAIQLDGTIAVAYRDRGLVYYFEGTYDNALADMEKAIQIDPKAAQSYLGRGMVLVKEGQMDRAVADFNKTLELSADPRVRQAAQDQLAALGK